MNFIPTSLKLKKKFRKLQKTLENKKRNFSANYENAQKNISRTVVKEKCNFQAFLKKNDVYQQFYCDLLLIT